jgi:hypothetical protein
VSHMLHLQGMFLDWKFYLTTGYCISSRESCAIAGIVSTLFPEDETLLEGKAFNKISSSVRVFLAVDLQRSGE